MLTHNQQNFSRVKDLTKMPFVNYTILYFIQQQLQQQQLLLQQQI